MTKKISLLVAVSVLACATPAWAKPGDPIETADGVTIDPILALRLRYETVDQDNALGTADALTLRGRFGASVSKSGFSFLAEGEGTLQLIDDYNDTIPSNGVEPFSVVADPENLELNRLQISYMKDGNGVTVGRQRIILDNARFVGNVGWRQNEQTFDAVRGQAKIGPVSLDATYSNSQRSIFGVDSPNEFWDGDIVLLNAGVNIDVLSVKAFGYIYDYDTRLNRSSQTYGFLAKAGIPLGAATLNATVSYATQSDTGANPTDYSADYINLELGAAIAGFNIGAGYEELGSDSGIEAFQTPLATLHAFNGWADLFLNTPAAGLRDYYGKVSKKIEVPGVTTFTATVVYHEFEADFGGMDYGSEIDASLGFAVGPVGLVVKYANFDSDGFAVDTEKFWLQAQLSF